MLSDTTGELLQMLSARQELNIQRQRVKKAALEKLSCGNSYESIAAELKAIEQNATIVEKLLEGFPSLLWSFYMLTFCPIFRRADCNCPATVSL